MSPAKSTAASKKVEMPDAAALVIKMIGYLFFPNEKLWLPSLTFFWCCSPYFESIEKNDENLPWAKFKLKQGNRCLYQLGASTVKVLHVRWQGIHQDNKRRTVQSKKHIQNITAFPLTTEEAGNFDQKNPPRDGSAQPLSATTTKTTN